MDIRNTPSSPKPSGHNLADFTRPNRDAIERGTPDAADIRAKLARTRAEQAARLQAAEEKQLAERIDSARAVHAERIDAARQTEARKDAAGGDVVDIDPAVADVASEERADLAAQAELAERAEAARDQLALEGRRAFNAREALGQRAANARDELSLSETSVRLRADAQPADEASRAERVAELRSLYQQGRLNTDELVARAAYNLLSGE